MSYICLEGMHAQVVESNAQTQQGVQQRIIVDRVKDSYGSSRQARKQMAVMQTTTRFGQEYACTDRDVLAKLACHTCWWRAL